MASSSKTNRYSFAFEASRRKKEKIVSLLSENSMSLKQLCDAVFITMQHIRHYVKALKEEKQVYISTWKFELNGNRWMQIAYFKAGNRPDAKKPPPLTNAERCKRHYKKSRADAENLDKMNLKRRLRRIKPKADWTSSWIKASSTTQANQDGA